MSDKAKYGKQMKKAFIFLFMFLLIYSYASVEALACGGETMFVVSETGTKEKLDEVVSLVKNNYDFEITEIKPSFYNASPTNDQYCPLGMSIYLVINQYGNFIIIKGKDILDGALVGAEDCVPVIKEIVKTFQQNNNLPIQTERVGHCQTTRYWSFP